MTKNQALSENRAFGSVAEGLIKGIITSINPYETDIQKEKKSKAIIAFLL